MNSFVKYHALTEKMQAIFQNGYDIGLADY